MSTRGRQRFTPLADDGESLWRNPPRLVSRAVQIIADEKIFGELFSFEYFSHSQLVSDALYLAGGLQSTRESKEAVSRAESPKLTGILCELTLAAGVP